MRINQHIHFHHLKNTMKSRINRISGHMMLARFVLLCAVFVTSISMLTAQVQVVRQRAVAVGLQSINDVAESTSLFELTLRNAGTSAVQLRVGGELSTNNTVVLQTVIERAPLITLQPGETRIIVAHDVFLRGAVSGAISTDAPTFPISDSYQVCYRVVNASGTEVIPRTCIVAEQPPKLDVAQARAQIRQLMGFNVTIGTIIQLDGGNFLVSGRLAIPKNNLFAVAEGRTVNFVNVQIPIDQLLTGATDVDPAGGLVRLVETELQATYNGWLPVTLRNAQGLTVRRETSLDGRPGSIREPMFINMNTLLARVPNSGVTGDVRLQLALGESLGANGSNDVPALISSSQLTLSRGLTIGNAADARWRIRGLDIGQLQNPSVSVTPDSMMIRAGFPISVEGFDITAFTINYIFRRNGEYDDSVTTQEVTKIGSQMTVRLNKGDIVNNGFSFTGALLLNARGFTAPITFNIANLSIIRNGSTWSIGATNFKYQRAAAGRISLFANNDADFTFATDRKGVFSITGRGTFGLGLPRGFQVGLPVNMKFDSEGVVEAVMNQRIVFGVPHSKSSNRNASGGTNGDATSAVRVEVNSITYTSPTQRVVMDGSLTMGLPRGVEFEAGNFGFDRDGIVSGFAKIMLRFRKGIKGGGGIIYERGDDKTYWGGSFDVSIDKGGKGNFGFGAEFRYAASDDWDLRLKFSKVPGYQLALTPPVWLEEIRGRIATQQSRWIFGLGGKFVVFTPSTQFFGPPGLDINADGEFRIGGDGPAELEIIATVDIRGFGFGTRLGNGNLLLNFTDLRFSGNIQAGMSFLGVVSADGRVNFDINIPANQFYIAGNVAYNVLNAARANGSFWLAKDYTVQAGPIRFVRTGFHADFSQRLIDWSAGINLGVASFSAYARAGYFWEIDIRPNGVGGRLQADVAAGGRASIIGIGFSGDVAFKIDGQFGYWNNNFTMDASAQGRIEVTAGSRRCNPGCNSVSFCGWWIGAGARAKICVGLGARVRYNRGFSIDVGRR
jgi:hypothetical protein